MIAASLRCDIETKFVGNSISLRVLRAGIIVDLLPSAVGMEVIYSVGEKDMFFFARATCGASNSLPCSMVAGC